VEMSDDLSILDITISLFSIFFSKKSKRCELDSMYRKEMVSWYSNVTELLNTLRDNIGHDDTRELNEKLARLSAFIDQGRFYFPNIIKDESYGKEKPTAFQGHRDLTLDFLVAYYYIARRKDANIHKNDLIDLQRFFTSRVFDCLQPRDFIKRAGKFTSIKADEEYSLEKFLISNSKEELLELYKDGKAEYANTSV
jgi:hypothetical protein